MQFIKTCWQHIRQLSGEDAYERYLTHYYAVHAQDADADEPLTRAAFYQQWQEQKWTGVKRCC